MQNNHRKCSDRIALGVFTVLGYLNIVFVAVICLYLLISGVPAIFKIGFTDFIFGTKWASTASEPYFGIMPFILTSVYGTVGAIILGLPVGFFTSAYLAKFAPKKLKAAVESVVDLLAGIPSVSSVCWCWSLAFKRSLTYLMEHPYLLQFLYLQ